MAYSLSSLRTSISVGILDDGIRFAVKQKVSHLVKNNKKIMKLPLIVPKLNMPLARK